MLSFTLLLVACSDSVELSGDEFLIEGIISNVEDGAVIILFRQDGDFGMSVARDTLKNNRFSFKLEAVSDPEEMSIMCSGEGYPPSSSLSVWVAPGKKIKITGNDKLFTAWYVKSSIQNQKEENRYTDKSREIIREKARLSIEYGDLRTKARSVASEDTALAQAYKKRADSIDNLIKTLSLPQSFQEIEIMEKRAVSEIWLDKMRGIAMRLKYSNLEDTDNLRKKAEELYARMSEEDKNSPVGYKITADLFPPEIAEIGDDMIDGDFSDAEGNTRHISEYSGKYLLLDFWSLGCGPCIMALPEMKEISEIYADKLTIISISTDTDATWKKAMTMHDMPWVNIRDPKGMGGLAANYGVTGIPNYVMISPEGKIIDKWMGFGSGLLKKKISDNLK